MSAVISGKCSRNLLARVVHRRATLTVISLGISEYDEPWDIRSKHSPLPFSFAIKTVKEGGLLWDGKMFLYFF